MKKIDVHERYSVIKENGKYFVPEMSRKTEGIPPHVVFTYGPYPDLRYALMSIQTILANEEVEKLGEMSVPDFFNIFNSYAGKMEQITKDFENGLYD